MSANSQQLKQNFVNHPYVQQANKVVSGQVNALDSEVSAILTFCG
jgi:receptor expression-enhancing protein 5/6